MTKLQNEILKLLNESNLTEEQLKEVSFDSITNELVKLNDEIANIDALLNGPAEQFKSQVNGLKNSLEEVMTTYNDIETYFNDKTKGGEAPKVPTYERSDKKDVQNGLSKLNKQTMSNDTKNNKDITSNPNYWNRLNKNIKDGMLQQNTQSQNMQVKNKPQRQHIILPGDREYYESIDNPTLQVQKEGIGNMFAKIRNAHKDKETAIDELETIFNDLNIAKKRINKGRHTYDLVQKQLIDLYEKIDRVHKMIQKKISWFGRNFGFWK